MRLGLGNDYHRARQVTAEPRQQIELIMISRAHLGQDQVAKRAFRKQPREPRRQSAVQADLVATVGNQARFGSG